MPGVREHEPVVIEEFNGLWDRGDPETVPLDHFQQADNIQYVHSAFKTRDPLDKYQDEDKAVRKIKRVYNYVMQTGHSLLALTEGGKIYHILGPSIVHGPILTIPAMDDFGFVSYAGRAYITPFKYYVDDRGMNYELGIPNEFVYVYKGDGTPARKAGGQPPTNGGMKPVIAYTTDLEGVVTAGVHIIAVATDGGPLGPEVFPVVNAPGEKQIRISHIPTPAGTTQKIVMSKAIRPEDYTTDYTGVVFYEVATVTNTEFLVINKADADLVTVYTPGAGTVPVTNAMTVENTMVVGHNDTGFHLVGVVYETDTGYLTAPGPEILPGMDYIDDKKAVKIKRIPTGSSTVVRRHLVSTKAIAEHDGNQQGFQFFFIPGGMIDDNTTTEITISYYDADLVDDASDLFDNFAEIPAGVNLNTYHSRLVVVGEFGTNDSLAGLPRDQSDNRSVARLSNPGDPESFSRVTGLIIVPLDGNPLTNVQEFRDVLYIFKRTRTYGYVDNQDDPSTWEEDVIDQAIGAPVHGIATVLDTGGVNIDYLLIGDWSGFMLFNGVYARPELSWKIEDVWLGLDRNFFRYVQIVNDSISKKVWITLPPPIRKTVLHLDYGNGLEPKSVKWCKWIFDTTISTVALIETTKLILGSSDT